ncbi:MAG TPA: glycerophosphodiester phosphodiesterase [Acidimicrobiales bacterium]|nr:glycerophosphodiester phosphodiesterase [Acidimicrobiales bacterium]
MTLVIGHRGAPLAEPENTVAAFRTAAAQGADGVELDVRRTADGALAVHHDAHLADGRAIVGVAWADVPEGVPDLDTALDACRDLAVVNVEIKNWPDDVDFDPSLAVVDRVVDALAARPTGERDRVLVSCFHLPSLDRVRERTPELATAWLVIGPVEAAGQARGAPTGDGGDPVAAMVAEAAAHGHRALHPHHAFVSPRLVAEAHEAGVAVNAWTCDDPERIRWLAEVGVDGVITNAPDVALAALGRGALRR